MSKKEMSMLDAFIALEDLEDEEIKMPVNEGKGFKLRDLNDMGKAKEFLEEQGNKETTLEVIDVNADTLDHLKDNKDYVGQMVIVCDSCGEPRFIDAEDLVQTDRLSEKTKTPIYNDETECTHCHQVGSGFTLRGQVGIVKPEGTQVEPKIENDSLTDETKFDNDFEQIPSEEPVSEPAEEESEEEYVEPEDNIMETTSEDDTEETLNDNAEETSEENSEESLTDEEEEEEDEDSYNEPLSPIEDEEEENKKDKKESLEEDIDTSLGTVADLFNNIIEPENIERVVIYDLDSERSEEEIFKGSFEDIPEQLFDSELIDFSVGSGILIINIDTESEIDELTTTLKTALNLFGDEFNSNISVWDQATGEEVFTGTKQSVIEEFGHYAFLSFESPETIELNVRGVKMFESLKTPYTESLNLADKEDKLIFDIIKANGLKEYKLDDSSSEKRYASAEYWIAESIKNKEDLEMIFNEFVLGKGEELVLAFKDVTGFKEAIDECSINEEVEANLDELHKEAKKLIEQNNAFACIYGYHKNGKGYGLKEKFIICKDPEQLKDKSEIVRLRYKPTGSIRVAYAGKAFEEFDYKNRKDLSQAILECEDNGIPYTIKRSIKEGYRYILIKESPDRGFFEPAEVEPEIIEPEVVNEFPAEVENTTSVMDPRDTELVNKLTRIAHDTAEAIREAYGVEVNERVILADIIQDLQLVSGQLTPEELENTPINNLTKAMYDAYNGFYEAMDELVSFVTGEQITTTTAQKLQQAIDSLDSDLFKTEAIKERIQDPSFLLAMQQGTIPGIIYNGNPREIRLLNAPEEVQEEVCSTCGKHPCECLNKESLKEDKEELPVDPEAAKLEVHTMLNDLVADEIEAINGYDDAKAKIVDTPIDHKDNILDTIDHIKGEEQEHIDELIDATTEIPFDKEEETHDLAAEEESLAEETHAKYAKPAGDKVKAYNNALKYAKKENKPFIYGYTNNTGKFFAADTPMKVSGNPVDAEKEFRNRYKNCSVVYVAYPDKEFIKETLNDKSLKEEKINIDYVVSLFGDDSHYYKEDDEVRCSPDISGATKFNKKKDISILDIVKDVCESQSKYMPENEAASLFDLDTLEEVYEKDEDYFINSGLVKIISVYKNKKIELPESLKEAKEELPADPEVVKADVHGTMANLVKDEVEAIDGYEEAKAQIADTHIEHKDDIIATIDHIEDEEKEHIDELIDAAKDIPFDKEEKSEEESTEEEQVEFDETKFESFINEWFDNNVEETKLFECLSGGIKEDGTIVLEGKLHLEEGKQEDASFILTPDKEVNEDLLNSNKVTTYTISCNYFPEGLVVKYSK